MKVMEFLDLSAIAMDIKSAAKKEAILELCQTLVANNKIQDAGPLVDVLMVREQLGSTGIGQGVAIPHAKSDQVKELTAALGISRKGVEFGSLDGEPVFVIFLLIAPANSSGDHLKALARISRLLKDKFFRQAIRNAKTPEEIQKNIREDDDY